MCELKGGGETFEINERASSQYRFSHVQIVSVTLCHRDEITQPFRWQQKKRTSAGVAV